MTIDPRRFVPGWHWTAEDIEVLREHYLLDGWETVAARLGRSRSAVFKKAQCLGLVRERRWTEKEDAEVKQMLADGIGIATIAGRLGRTESGVFHRARRIGFPTGRPADFEYLYPAAERTGFAPQTLIKIMRAAKMPIRVAQSEPKKRYWPARYRRHIVDPIDVDEAVEKWLNTETVGAAERRHGLKYGTLNHALRRAGHKHPPGHRPGQHWRVKSDFVDRFVEEHKLGTRRRGYQGIRPGRQERRAA